MTSRNKTFKVDLVSDSSILPPGRITIMAEELNPDSNREMIYFTPKASFSNEVFVSLGIDMCFFIIYKRLNEDYTPIYKSEVQKSESSGLFFWRQV